MKSSDFTREFAHTFPAKTSRWQRFCDWAMIRVSGSVHRAEQTQWRGAWRFAKERKAHSEFNYTVRVVVLFVWYLCVLFCVC